VGFEKARVLSQCLHVGQRHAAGDPAPDRGRFVGAEVGAGGALEQVQDLTEAVLVPV
jgi:hypothetical protein